ncbi:MAG: type II toxin-antitoxin system prevent-host-death family antitoxin [Aestuariivita sp.]|nr:type II toxin-antitoxin system prevent-host-death family antitoxin [Aestuariivita sp.]MCY4203864.1 type II toxin-antitoxin system prevent-host-death family antitoxin [Aestuariivita sp.]
MQVNVHTAKTTLSDLILRAEAGEEVVIARRGKPAVRMVPVTSRMNRNFGRFKDLEVKGDILKPLGSDELRYWEGE